MSDIFRPDSHSPSTWRETCIKVTASSEKSQKTGANTATVNDTEGVFLDYLAGETQRGSMVSQNPRNEEEP